MPSSESKKNPVKQVEPVRKRKSKYINMDSTERKLVNNGKNAPNAKFRNFLDNLGDVVYETDASGNVAYTNKVAEKITGIPLKDIIGKSFLPLFTKESQQVAIEVYKRTLNGESTECELTFTNGKVCHFKNEPLRDENGQVTGVFSIARDITKRKQVEKMLRDSEERYKNLFNNSLVGLYRTTPDGRILMANPVLVKMLGYDSFEELARRNLEDEGYHPEYPRSVFKERISLESKVTGLESAWKRSDGTTLYVRESAQAVRDESGNIMYYQGTVEDITEHRQIAMALHSSEEMFETLVANMSEGVDIVDENLCCMFANSAGEEIFGVEAGGLVGRTLHEFVSEEGHKRIEEQLSKRREGVASSYDLEIIRPDGRKRQLIVTGTPRFSEDGKYLGALAIFFDVTKRKQAEEVLRKAHNELEMRIQERTAELQQANEALQAQITERIKAEDELKKSKDILQKTFTSLDSAVFILDAKMPPVIIDCNPTATRIFGYENEEMLGKTTEFLHVSKETLQEFQKTLNHAIVEQGGLSFFEFKMRRKDGRVFPSEHSVCPLKDNKGRTVGWVSVVRDITERKQAEKEIGQNEKEKSTILENMSELIVYRNRDMETVWASKSAADWHGLSHKEIRGRVCYKERYGRKEPCEGCYVIETMKSGKHRELDTRSPDGRYWHVKVNPVFNDSGQVIGTIEVSQDITERKCAQEVLRAREQTLRALINAPTESAILIDTEGKILDINRIAAQRLGQNTEQLIGQSIYNYLPTDIAEYRKTHGHEVIRSGKPVRFQDEREGRCYDNNLYPVFDSEGKVSSLAVFAGDVTERKQAEDRLRQYEFMVESAHDAIFFKDRQSRYIVANKKTLESFGMSRKQVIGKNDYEIMSETEEAKQNIDDDQTVFETGKPKEIVKEMTGANGEKHWFQAIKVPQFDENGEVIGLIGIARDITEHKKAENALRESEEKHKSMIELAPDVIVVVNKLGVIVSCNSAAQKISGYSKDELVGRHFTKLGIFKPRDIPKYLGIFARVLKGSVPEPFEVDFIRKGGGRGIVEVRVSLLEDGSIQTIATDIAERKMAEQALRESEERLKILFESAPDAIYLIDSKGRFVDGNRAAEDLIGFKKTEVIGKSLAELGLLSAGQLSKARANLKKVAAGKLSGPNEYTLKRKDGSHISVEVRTFPVKIGGKILTQGIARDITGHKRTEKKLLEHQAKLKSLASRLSLAEERERYRLATDLHDQISQSLVISKIKLDQLHKSSGSNEFTESLKDISNCLGQVIDDTRALTFDLSYPILYELGFEAAVAEWLTDQIQVKHGIKTEFTNDGHQKPLDDDIRVLLFRNVRELLINVVKHAQPKKVKVSIRRIKDNIRIGVEDDGIGFDPNEVMSMSAKRAEFGLFSVRERLEQLGGLIEIDSRVGHGTKIMMTAPLKKKEAIDKV
jgi:PAS domain S-box-containing protein